MKSTDPEFKAATARLADLVLQRIVEKMLAKVVQEINERAQLRMMYDRYDDA